MNVQFPGLGLELDISRKAFEIFGLEIYWYGVIIAFALLVCVVLATRCCRKYGIEPDNILDIVLIAAPTALVFARLYYVVFSWDQYKDNLIDILKVRDGGLAIYGAVIGAVLAAWLYTRYKKISFLQLADFAVPYLVLGQAIGRWGNFVNQEAFGTATTLPWRMNGYYPDKYLSSLPENLDLSKWGVHPTFLYESLWDFCVFLILLNLRKRKKVEGEVFFLYFVLYGAGRFLIEGIRSDSLMLGSIRVSQLLSLVLALVFAALFIYKRKKTTETETGELPLGQSNYGSILMKLKAEEETENKTENENEVSEEKADATDRSDEECYSCVELQNEGKEIKETDGTQDGESVSEAEALTENSREE